MKKWVALAVVALAAGCGRARDTPAPISTLPVQTVVARPVLADTAPAWADSSRWLEKAAAVAESESDSARLVQHGRQLYVNKRCGRCHTIGAGYREGPDLEGVTEQHSFGWFAALWLETEEMLQVDPDLQQLRMEHFLDMPNPDLSGLDAIALYAYLRSASARARTHRK
jgi:cytochrome c2